jgi:hypothetical protein
MMKNLLMTVGVSLICGALGAAGYFHFLGPKPDESASSSSVEKSDSGSGKGAAKRRKSDFSGTQSVMESNSHGAAWIPGFTSADDIETLKGQIANLAQRFDGLTERVDRMTRPKDETPPVLRTMQIKMADLARAMDNVAALPAKVRECETHLETLQEEIKSLRLQIESQRNGQGRREAASTELALPRQTGASAPPSGVRNDEGPQMELGISLLQRGQYASACEVFDRLREAQPRDARVWYFAGLAAGLASGKWEGEAKQFVDKGIDLERKGSPATAQVDAALATRVPIEGVPWLNSLRRQALSAKNSP